jgi:HD-GYP domain-containing protein (c-di-GMP phosphodiesterase class II)
MTSVDQIKRGALLKDIGKRGVSVQILKKTGLLKEEEWVLSGCA